MALLQTYILYQTENKMFKQKQFFAFVLFSSLLGGCGSFFLYNLISNSLILSIIVGIAVAVFIGGMEILFVAKMLATMKYQLQRDSLIQSLEKRRRQSWLRSFLRKMKFVKGL